MYFLLNNIIPFFSFLILAKIYIKQIYKFIFSKDTNLKLQFSIINNKIR